MTKKCLTLYLTHSTTMYYNHHQEVPCLEQALTTMDLHLFLSHEAFMNVVLLICFCVAQLLRLSIYVSRCLPLHLLPSIFPVILSCSNPPFLQTWPMNFICLFRIVLISDISMFAIFNTSWFVFFSVHDILRNLLMNQLPPNQ